MNSNKFKIISNTTPIIALSSIDKLNLLNDLYGEIVIPETVKREIEAGGRVQVPDLEVIEWIKVVDDIKDIKEKLLLGLDDGEKQTILVALAVGPNSIALIDERKGRKVATTLGLKIKGTLGILADAKREGLIDSFKKFAYKLIENNLYYSLKLIETISGEVDQ